MQLRQNLVIPTNERACFSRSNRIAPVPHLPPHPLPRYNFAMLMPEARVAPPVSALEATRLALALYGADASARPLPGEYDDNFHLVSDRKSTRLNSSHRP